MSTTPRTMAEEAEAFRAMPDAAYADLMNGRATLAEALDAGTANTRTATLAVEISTEGPLSDDGARAWLGEVSEIIAPLAHVAGAFLDPADGPTAAQFARFGEYVAALLSVREEWGSDETGDISTAADVILGRAIGSEATEQTRARLRASADRFGIYYDTDDDDTEA